MGCGIRSRRSRPSKLVDHRAVNQRHPDRERPPNFPGSPIIASSCSSPAFATASVVRLADTPKPADTEVKLRSSNGPHWKRPSPRTRAKSSSLTCGPTIAFRARKSFRTSSRCIRSMPRTDSFAFHRQSMMRKKRSILKFLPEAKSNDSQLSHRRTSRDVGEET